MVFPVANGFPPASVITEFIGGAIILSSLILASVGSILLITYLISIELSASTVLYLIIDRFVPGNHI
ncbi:hypothetical protein D3C78_1391020 [compost metagenome]